MPIPVWWSGSLTDLIVFLPTQLFLHDWSCSLEEGRGLRADYMVLSHARMCLSQQLLDPVVTNLAKAMKITFKKSFSRPTNPIFFMKQKPQVFLDLVFCQLVSFEISCLQS